MLDQGMYKIITCFASHSIQSQKQAKLKKCFEFQFALLRRTMVGAQLQLISTSANRRWLRLAPPFAKVSVCRALSYVQTDATTPNIVASCCVRIGSGV